MTPVTDALGRRRIAVAVVLVMALVTVLGGVPGIALASHSQKEPNDFFESAAEISGGQFANTELGTASDITGNVNTDKRDYDFDWFKFSVDSSKNEFTLNLDNDISQDGDIAVDLYDPDGKFVKTAQTETDDETLSHTVTDAAKYGDWRIKVYAADDPENNNGDAAEDCTSSNCDGTYSGTFSYPPTADATSPDSDNEVEVGESISFDGTGTTDPDDSQSALTFSWDFKDGTTGSGTSPSHTFTAAGTYEVTLTVTDSGGGSDTDTVSVDVVDNTDPTADAGSDKTVDEDASVSFDGTASTDNDDISTYEWDWTDDSSYETTGSNPTHTYNQPGTYTVRLRTTDPSGNTDTDTLSVTVADVTDPAAEAGNDRTVDEDTSLSFDGTGSSDNVGVTTYEWDWTDDSFYETTGANPSHTYAQPGTYTVRLRTTDAAGNTDTDTLSVTVADVTDPTADAGSDKSVDEDASVSFDGTGSSDNVGVTKYEWDWTDDSSYETTGANPTHTYDEPGTYTVRLRITDDAGNTDTDTLSVTVADVTDPAAEAGNDRTVDEDTTLSFDGTASTDNVGVTTYEWDFGDGAAATGASPTHTFADPGTYDVSLTVTDAAGNTDTDTMTVTVTDTSRPDADAGSDATVDEGEPVGFDGSGSSDNVGVTTYMWDVDGDGLSEEGDETFTHTYDQPGTYQVELTVTDGEGNFDTDTVTVTVRDTTAPSAETGADRTVDAGTTVRFDGTASTDNAGIASYAWDLDGDGSTDATGPTPTETLSTPGTYDVALTVTDAAGNSDTETVTVTAVDATAPTADAGGNLSVDEGARVRLDGSNSTDDTGIASYEWDLDGDGAIEVTGATPTHVFDRAGTSRVTLTVTDAAGNSDSDTAVVTVREVDAAPEADAGSNRTVTNGTAVTLDGSNSTDDRGIASYVWDVDSDGIGDATGAVANHTFESPGNYTVRLQVTDAAGNADLDTVVVTVTDGEDDETGDGENETDETDGCERHVSGVCQRVYDAVAGDDGDLERSDLVTGVGRYVDAGSIDGVTITRDDVLALVEYYVTRR